MPAKRDILEHLKRDELIAAVVHFGVEVADKRVRESLEDVERYARVVGVAEVAKNDFNLNITRYVETAKQREKVDVRAALAKLREAEAARDAAKATMDRYLRELGFGDPT